MGAGPGGENLRYTFGHAPTCSPSAASLVSPRDHSHQLRHPLIEEAVQILPEPSLSKKRMSPCLALTRIPKLQGARQVGWPRRAPPREATGTKKHLYFHPRPHGGAPRQSGPETRTPFPSPVQLQNSGLRQRPAPPTHVRFDCGRSRNDFRIGEPPNKAIPISRPAPAFLLLIPTT